MPSPPISSDPKQPESQARWRALPVLLLRGVLRGYQLLLSPLFGPCCRFEPSCSEYAREAIAAHGAWRGSWLAIRRLTRCHPWGPHGYDPVPESRCLPKRTGVRS